MILKAGPQSIFQAALKLIDAPQTDIVFKKGDLVEGEVLKTISKSQALVKLSGIELVALTESKLLQGQKIVGRVASVSPQITINLLQGESAKELKTNQLMRLLMPSKVPMGKAFDNIISMAKNGGLPPNIQTVIDTLASEIKNHASIDLETVTPDKVKSAVKTSGLHLESSLKSALEAKAPGNSIKAIAGGNMKTSIGRAMIEVETYIARQDRQAQTMPDTAAKELTRASESVKILREAYNNIELNQLLNSSAKEKDGIGKVPLLYQLPFLEGLNMETARVYVQHRDEGRNLGNNESGEDSTVVFMLDMSQVGPVRVDVHVGHAKVAGSIYVLNDTVVKHVKESLPSLVEHLEEVGYDARFEVTSANKKFVTEQMEIKNPITARGIVDVKV